MKRIFLICFSIMFLAGCTSAIKSVASKYESRLSIGLTKEEVRERLGDPSRVSSQSHVSKDTGELYEVSYWIYNYTRFWHYPNVTEQLYITFLKDEVVSWGPNPDMTIGLESKSDIKKEIIIKER